MTPTVGCVAWAVCVAVGRDMRTAETRRRRGVGRVAYGAGWSAGLGVVGHVVGQTHHDATVLGVWVMRRRHGGSWRPLLSSVVAIRRARSVDPIATVGARGDVAGCIERM